MRYTLVYGALITSRLLIGCTGTTTIRREDLGNDTTKGILVTTKDGREFSSSGHQYSKLLVNNKDVLRMNGEFRMVDSGQSFIPFEGMIPIDSVETAVQYEFSAANTAVLVVFLSISVVVGIFALREAYPP